MRDSVQLATLAARQPTAALQQSSIVFAAHVLQEHSFEVGKWGRGPPRVCGAAAGTQHAPALTASPCAPPPRLPQIMGTYEQCVYTKQVLEPLAALNRLTRLDLGRAPGAAARRHWLQLRSLCTLVDAAYAAFYRVYASAPKAVEGERRLEHNHVAASLHAAGRPALAPPMPRSQDNQPTPCRCSAPCAGFAELFLAPTHRAYLTAHMVLLGSLGLALALQASQAQADGQLRGEEALGAQVQLQQERRSMPPALPSWRPSWWSSSAALTQSWRPGWRRSSGATSWSWRPSSAAATRRWRRRWRAFMRRRAWGSPRCTARRRSPRRAAPALQVLLELAARQACPPTSPAAPGRLTRVPATWRGCWPAGQSGSARASCATWWVGDYRWFAEWR